MKITKTLNIATLCIALTAFTTSCSNEHKDSKDTAEDMNDEKFEGKAEKEADKLVGAFSSNLFEVRMSENAALNAATPEVKKLAMHLVEAHSRMNEDVKALATKKQVSLPTDLTEEQREDIEKLAEKSGLDYDKAYTDKMKEKHEDAIRNYEKISDKCSDAEIKNWASETLPEVRNHMDMVMTTHNSIKDRK